MSAPRKAAHEMLEIRQGHIRKSQPLTLDLNGMAKGYGVDRLAETFGNLGLDAGLVGIEGEMRVSGLRPDGRGWTIAIEGPDPGRRAPYAILALQDAAVATSGDYRHRVLVKGRHLSHTMAPRLGAPLRDLPASVTVIHESCMAADAWATALMVIGSAKGSIVARNQNLNALFMDREDDQLREPEWAGCSRPAPSVRERCNAAAVGLGKTCSGDNALAEFRRNLFRLSTE